MFSHRPLFESAEGQEERQGPGGKGPESLMAVEGTGGLVLGINDQGKGFHVALEDAEGGIGQQGAAETPAPEALIDGKAADKRRR